MTPVKGFLDSHSQNFARIFLGQYCNAAQRINLSDEWLLSVSNKRKTSLNNTLAISGIFSVFLTMQKRSNSAKNFPKNINDQNFT